MNYLSPQQATIVRRHSGTTPLPLEKLRQLLEDKVQLLQGPAIETQQQILFEENNAVGGGEGTEEEGRGRGEGSYVFQSLTDLQKQTEEELASLHTRLAEIRCRRQLLTSELLNLQEKNKRETDEEVNRKCHLQQSSLLSVGEEVQASISDICGRLKELDYQEDAVSALRSFLKQDLERYRDLGQSQDIRAAPPSMHEKSEMDHKNNMESEFDSSKQSDSPASEEEPITPRGSAPGPSPSPIFQLNLVHSQGNGLSRRSPEVQRGGGSAGENGPRLTAWEPSRLGPTNYRGSLESLASRDWDTMSDRMGGFDSPPRAFQSPYANSPSIDFNPSFRLPDFKGGLSPATSEMNLYSYNSRSTSPVHSSSLSNMASRTRFSTYDTLRRRPEVSNNVVSHMPLRSATLGGPNKRDFIEELTKQLDTIQKRNTFLEAESVEMEKERNQIRFEMRGLLVNNEDLLRTNTQLTNEVKRMREHIMELERENQTVSEKYRQLEVEIKEARNLMVEANTQEYAFNFLQQSLKNKIQDAEENLEKQTHHAQTMAEKLWLAERQVEELEVDKETRDKRNSELICTVSRLEQELGDAILLSSQAGAELNLQQKLRQDAQLRVEELEESLLEKNQELQRVQAIVVRLQGEVSGKLIDKERTLEDEIQQRERLQLQCKQAERTVEDLHMELQTANQAREDTMKQLKTAQEKMIDLETDLEEVHESEQRWAIKHKRAIEQIEQLQQKVIQEQHLSEQLDSEKVSMERQLRQLRLEVEELHSSRVQEDIISKSEGRVKELENALRAEERNKLVLSNNVTKLERKISELTDQMEEEHRISTEQKDLMTQRIRALKRQLNEAEEETGRKEAQYRHAQRELAEEREAGGRLQRQLLDQHLQMKRKESMMMRQTLDNLRLDLSVDEDETLEKEQIAIV
ncbi:unnamed protein product [Lota lota]